MRDVDKAEILFQIAVSLMAGRNRLKEAVQLLRLALDEDPANQKVRLQLGIALRAQGHLKEAVRTLQTARTARPDDPDIIAHLGTAYARQRNLKAALECYRLALGQCPDHPYARINTAIVSGQAGDWAAAAAMFEQLQRELPPESPYRPSVVSQGEELRILLGRVADAGVDPTLDRRAMAVGLYRAANRRSIAGDQEGALALYELTARLRPDYADDAFTVGETLEAHHARKPKGEYVSCRWIESGMHFHEDKLRFCCVGHGEGKGWTEIGDFHGGHVPLDYVLSRRAKLIDDINEDNDTGCRGCPMLENKIWSNIGPIFSSIIVNSFSVCNLHCVYCSLPMRNYEMPSYYYMVEPAFDQLMATGWLAADAYVLWGGGDPSVSKEFPSIATKLLDFGCTLNVNTNAVMAPAVIVDALRQGRCDVGVSIDAGSREMFYKIKFNSDEPVLIKGKEAFDLVWEHVALFARLAPERTRVKYILTDMNAKSEEIDIFLDRCLEAGVRNVLVTPEWTSFSSGSLNDEVRASIVRAVRRGREAGFAVAYTGTDLPDSVDNGALETVPEDLRKNFQW